MLLSNLDEAELKMTQELKEQIQRDINQINQEIALISNSTYSWLEKPSNLLKLSQEAVELFNEGSPKQKMQLLDFVSSNLVLRDKQVEFTYNKPFDSLTKIKSEQMKRPDKKSGRFIWLTVWDSLRMAGIY